MVELVDVPPEMKGRLLDKAIEMAEADIRATASCDAETRP